MEVIKNYGDAELLQAIQDDRNMDDAIRYLYRNYFDGMSIYVQQNQGNRQDAEDIFQESIVAFIQLVQQNRFRGDASIKTFLFAINKNTWLNELKRRGRADIREAKFETAKETVDAGITHYITGREARATVLGVMDKLGEGCKKILLAFYYENLSMKEILGTMNYENDQVLRNKKHKCLKQLEQLLTANPAMAKTLKAALQYEQ
jgi:RNA polymerase sigma factor (sigma-70 family)